MSKLLGVSEELRNGSRVVAIKGEFDLHSATKVRESLERAAADRASRLVIDLSDCAFIDSTGLATIVHVTRPLRDDGEKVHLVCPDGDVRKLLELSALELTFPIHNRLDEAIEPSSSESSED